MTWLHGFHALPVRRGGSTAQALQDLRLSKWYMSVTVATSGLLERLASMTATSETDVAPVVARPSCKSTYTFDWPGRQATGLPYVHDRFGRDWPSLT